MKDQETLCYGIIPTRYASTRFPGKALVDILGKPMFWHVWERARQCKALQSVTLATDDRRIADVASQLGVPWVMTDAKHPSGTDRVHEAACLLNLPDDAVIVNIQGDEPLLAPQNIVSLLEPFANTDVHVTTLATPILPERAALSQQVKTVLAANGDALYFSRAPIPFVRDSAPITYLGHIGLYAFRKKALESFVALPPSVLEQQEQLEQLRLIENGIPIRVQVVKEHCAGVDTPEDLLTVQMIMNRAEAY